MKLFIGDVFENPSWGVTWIAVVIFSICCHEYAHALVAKLCGDNTAANSGHLTLNPLKQMGVFSLAMLLFIGIAWGMVPVNPANMRGRWGRLWVSLAGIGANIVLFAICLIATAVADLTHAPMLVTQLFYIGTLLNLILAGFNLIPVPPLDGFTAFREIFPEMKKLDASEFGRGLSVLLFMLVFAYGGRLFSAARDVVVENSLIFVEKILLWTKLFGA
ncbi:MAG: site-2 protease family protein [Victivallaceae bacterium]|nr:site-2 protease family protein [Victivallaceae bacterium]